MVKMPTRNSTFIPLKGGIDLSTTPLAKAPGFALAAVNVDALASGGYARTLGYDRFDGRPSPSRNRKFTSIDVGDAPDAAHPVFTAITWAGGSGAYLSRSGHFINAVIIEGSITAGTILDIAGVGYVAQQDGREYSKTKAENIANQAIAADWRRSQIGPVPGVGPVRGVIAVRNTVFAVRDIDVNTGGLFMASEAGWQQITSFGWVLTVTNVANISNGDVTLTRTGDSKVFKCVAQLAADGKSGVVVVAPGDAPAVGNVLTGLGDATCTVASVSTITIKAGGSYQAAVHNFFGGTGQRAAYVASGVQRAFELREDGWLVPLHAQPDATKDKPLAIAIHSGHLFLGYEGGQYQHSAPGNPHTWSALLGAESFSIGDEITAMLPTTGGVLVIASARRVFGLYGSSSKDWEQRALSESVGIAAGTGQSLFLPVGLSDRGLVRLDRVQEFGDFALNQLDPDHHFKAMIDGMDWAFSTQIAELNQYRLFSRGLTHLAVTILADGSPMATTFQYPSAVAGVWRYTEQGEQLFFCLSGSEGMVFTIDKKSRSFDGAAISWRIRLPFAHSGSPGVKKTWLTALVEQTSPNQAPIQVKWSIDHMIDAHFTSQKVHSIVSEDPSAAWDQVAIWNQTQWNQFYWSGSYGYTNAPIDLSGTSASISILMGGASSSDPNFTITGVTLDYFARRARRG
ncbi:TPA: hypothetical protein P2I16_001583 [Aeromonas salmonicida]|nr:hypothetical protein [Aeromonas salmonicida]